eukprot:TRINITY_DN1676_c0_g1_i1.p1 TRINITY_DN1676_c0_g1~~TRINITY_DN1676_c0_g1_i1.p1  ORF type:complete len:269 (-),score=46.68 TRINITY_DN1676_c0_g1_i1:32-838(-)
MRLLTALTLAFASLSALCNAGYYGVSWYTNTNVHITEFSMKFNVPPLPSQKSGTLFIWPGLEPLSGGANYNPIGLGVLQPVLTYGASCAPNQPAEVASNPYSTWFISGMYVGEGSVAGHTGCLGGNVMTVPEYDWLYVNMSLNGNTWTQTVYSKNTGKSVSYSLDMLGQAQNWAILTFENYGDFTPSPAWTVQDISIKMSGYDSSLCQSSSTAYPADNRVQCSGVYTNGYTCSISTCAFRAGFPLPSSSTAVEYGLHTLMRTGVIGSL